MNSRFSAALLSSFRFSAWIFTCWCRCGTSRNDGSVLVYVHVRNMDFEASYALPIIQKCSAIRKIRRIFTIRGLRCSSLETGLRRTQIYVVSGLQVHSLGISPYARPHGLCCRVAVKSFHKSPPRTTKEKTAWINGIILHKDD